MKSQTVSPDTHLRRRNVATTRDTHQPAAISADRIGFVSNLV